MVHPEILKQFPLLSSLNAQELLELSQHASQQVVMKKEMAYKKDDNISHIYFVIKGAIRLGSKIDEDKILVKHIAYEGEVFGENIFAGNKRAEFAEAIKDSTIIAVASHMFGVIISGNIGFAQQVTQVVIERIDNLEQRMKSFIFQKAYNRVSEFIANTALRKGTRIGLDEILINHGMSHKDISYLTDTSRQTVTKILADLKHNNLIHFSARKPNKILVRDINSLRISL